jgi:hypothetical protein
MDVSGFFDIYKVANNENSKVGHHWYRFLEEDFSKAYFKDQN